MTGRGHMTDSTASTGVLKLEERDNGVWCAAGARIIDRTGRKMLPIGRDGFVPAIQGSVVIDKTMLIADVLDSGRAVTLFCRPRRFGKTLNMTMMKAFFEKPIPDSPLSIDPRPLFEGTAIWDAQDGRYREHLGAYPVVCMSFNTAKKLTWEACYGEIRNLVAAEFARHTELEGSQALSSLDRELYRRIIDGSASDADFYGSLAMLCRMLRAHHGRGVVVLMDEYDAPVMAGYTNGYYREVVDFLKGWLTGALKDGGASLDFACMTGVQRITKESVFSDLNNLTVSTPLSLDFDERFGFTDDEVAALAAYLGHGDCMAEARAWYDGYRFGETDVYNPWSVLNYFANNCAADVYWGNTSSNSVVGDAVRRANSKTLERLYSLLEPGGTISSPLETGCVFPDVGVREGTLWSMLYLSGYLTTELTALPNDKRMRRPLRIPNKEVSQIFRDEVIERFTHEAGGDDRLVELQDALVAGDESVFSEALCHILQETPSMRDLISENSVHMLLTGLLYGVAGYGNPISNREGGTGYYDLRLEPLDLAPDAPQAYYAAKERPLITIEVKFAKCGPADAQDMFKQLNALAETALEQIAEKRYDEGVLPAGATGRLRWGVAFCGKTAVARCARP